jgi:hypothetical protein
MILELETNVLLDMYRSIYENALQLAPENIRQKLKII